jgi:hypothetical protein
MPPHEYERHYLWEIERAFRCMKIVGLELRPVYHWLAERVRSHVLLCMLAYYVECHTHQCLAPMVFDDHDRAAADAGRVSPVVKAKVSLQGGRPESFDTVHRRRPRSGPAGALLPHPAEQSGDTDPQHRLLRRTEDANRSDNPDARAAPGI